MYCDRQPGVPGQLRRDRVRLRLRQVVSLRQGFRIRTPREGPDFVQKRLLVRGLMRNLPELPGDGRIGGQVPNENRVAARSHGEVVENRRHQNDAIQRHPAGIERIRQRRRTRGAVGFAEQELGRVPPVVHRHVALNELLERRYVLVGAGEVPDGPRPHRPRKPGAHGVHKHQIGLVEQAVLVRRHLVRSGAGSLRTGRHHPHRPHRTHVQPHARRARTAVIEERHRPGAKIADAHQGVRDIKDGAVRLGVVAIDQQGPRRGAVVDGLAIQRQFMVGDGIGLRRNGSRRPPQPPGRLAVQWPALSAPRRRRPLTASKL